MKKASGPPSLASLLQQLPEARKALRSDSPQLAGLLAQIGLVLLEQQKWTEAEPLILSGYEGMKAREARIPPPGKPRLTDPAERVVTHYEAWGQATKAAEWRARLSKPSDESKPQP